MYYEHFGLAQAPFKITPNTDFFFGGGNRGAILEALIYAISYGEGIIKVTGEVGSGKTMLCNTLLTRLTDKIETVYLANPSVSPGEILHAIAFELHLPVAPDAPRLVVMHALQDYVIQRHAEGKRVVVIVEESQGMPIPTLEEIRLLSNLDTKDDKLLQMALFGQPELDDNLRQPEIRQLKDRITHSFRLAPLTLDETREYLMFRMRTAGYRGPELFPKDVVEKIHRVSGGLTRRINLITDKALLAAFAENTHTLRAKHVDAAIRDSEFAQTAPVARISSRQTSGWQALGWTLLGIAGGAAAVWGWMQHQAQSGAGKPESPISTRIPESASAPTGIEEKSIKSDIYIKPADRVTPPAGASATEVRTSAGSGSASTATATVTPGVSKPKSESTGVAADAAPTVAVTAPEARKPENIDKKQQVISDRLPENFLAERLAATEKWLAAAAAETVTVQLLVTTNETQLNQHLKILAKILENNDFFVYRTLAKGDPSLVVVYGQFGETAQAQAVLDGLPEALKRFKPVLRTVNGIRKEIKEKSS